MKTILQNRELLILEMYFQQTLEIGDLEDGRSITLGLDFKKEKIEIKKENSEEDLDEINNFEIN